MKRTPKTPTSTKGVKMMTNNGTLPTVSVMATGSSVAAFFSGETLIGWVMLGINIATLITNCAISIYRKIRDRDKDLEEKKGGTDDETLPR